MAQQENDKSITKWLSGNAVSIAIAIATLISTYAVYGYRLSSIEARQDRQGDAITQLQKGNTDTQVALARIQTDIEYIKTQLQKIVP